MRGAGAVFALSRARGVTAVFAGDFDALSATALVPPAFRAAGFADAMRRAVSAVGVSAFAARVVDVPDFAVPDFAVPVFAAPDFGVRPPAVRFASISPGPTSSGSCRRSTACTIFGSSSLRRTTRRSPFSVVSTVCVDAGLTFSNVPTDGFAPTRFHARSCATGWRSRSRVCSTAEAAQGAAGAPLCGFR